MAFAITDITRENYGTVSVMRGKWTAAVGDAAGTVTLGTPVVSAEFYDNTSSGPKQQRVTISGLGTVTITVYHQTTVTDGKFVIQMKG